MKKITKSDAPTLDDLRDILNVACEARTAWEYESTEPEVPRVDELYDVTSLPVYGDLNPEDTTGIYSWDDTRVLVCDVGGTRPWVICDVE